MSQTLGILWDELTPQIESTVLRDVLSLKDEWPDLKLHIPAIADSTTLKTRLDSLGVPVVVDPHTEIWKVYYEKEQPIPPPSAKKVYKRKMTNGILKLNMRPGVTNYPEFPDVTRPAPGFANPFNKPMPPRNGRYLLPPWAYTASVVNEDTPEEWKTVMSDFDSHPIEVHQPTPQQPQVDTDLMRPAMPLSFEQELPFAAKSYNISSDPKDYLIHAVLVMITDIPNRNGVAFPLTELVKWNDEYGMQHYKTWKGKPMFVEHESDVIKEAIGIILDVALTPLRSYGTGEQYKVIALVAIDRTKNPSIAQRIAEGKLNTYSMGAMVSGYTCSYCKAEVGKCPHIDPNDKVTFYELNGKLTFKNIIGPVGYELSAVEDPAWIFANDTRDSSPLDLATP